jgi:rSAM/selenodomain-associated transferase 1
MIFARVPEPGSVKTRLAAVIGDEAACALHRCFVDDTLALAHRTGCDTTVCYYPLDMGETVERWLGPGTSAAPQKGADLGERMAGAFSNALENHHWAVLMGSDMPDLPLATLYEAFESLEFHDAVICPTQDGGYCLIGFAREGFTSAPFQRMPWGGRRVFEDTMETLRMAGSRVHVLPPWKDIDDYDDLKRFFRENESLPPGTFSSIDFLRNDLGW